MIEITDGVDTVELTEDLYWVDEFTWSPVTQSVEKTITGALIIQAAAQQAGRPITLQPEDSRSGWTTYGVIAQLKTWAAVAGKELTLTLRGVDYTVIFRHQDGALGAEPVVFFSDRDNNDYCLVTLRFMVIE